MAVENGSSPVLERKLGLFPLTNIVIANMIGAGIFTTSGLLLSDLSNPLLMLALWVVGGIIALCGPLAYGELGAAIPDAGGEYAFLSKLYHLSSNLRLKLNSPRPLCPPELQENSRTHMQKKGGLTFLFGPDLISVRFKANII